jgi:hypothetical protein
MLSCCVDAGKCRALCPEKFRTELSSNCGENLEVEGEIPEDDVPIPPRSTKLELVEGNREDLSFKKFKALASADKDKFRSAELMPRDNELKGDGEGVGV